MIARNSTYRADIDGLRAAAVLPVVLYHAGIPGFSGGYVGVDVFFVISGFLITGIIWSEILTGNFSLVNFYERRARRILPALFAVIAVSLFIGSLVLLPTDFEDLSKSALATIVFVSNGYFWLTLNYFDTAAGLHPLLHSWSLAIEEQFYIVFPLFLIVAAKYRYGLMLGLMAVLFVLSLAGSVYAVDRTPHSAFYLSPARGWELLMGSFLALGLGPQLRARWSREGVAAAGLALIVLPIVVYSDQTPFPGIAALPVCVGTACLIRSSSNGSTLVGRVLSLRPVVFVGLISYSLYLWHWPVLVFLRHYFGVKHLELSIAIIAICASFLAALLSWRYIERPFRQKGLLSRRQIFSAVGYGAAVMALICGAVWMSRGVPMRFNATIVALDQGQKDINPRRRECTDRLPDEGLCKLGTEGDKPPTFLLWGDSHAIALMPAVAVAGRHARRSGVVAAAYACPPLLGIQHIHTDGRRCRNYNDGIIAMLKQDRMKITTVILAARWALWATGLPAPQEGGPNVVIKDDQSAIAAISDNIDVFSRGLKRTVEALNQLGLSVVILGNVPEIGWNVPTTLARAADLGRPAPSPPTLNQVLRRSAGADRVITKLVKTLDLRFVPISAILCQSTCKIVDQGHPIYSDDDHLSFYGASKLLGPALVGRIW
ncbi:O-acetyltransferase OatA [bacterium MnTg02]|nr:O-acetyltransferase OatA [bacterium MnTg02]